MSYNRVLLKSTKAHCEEQMQPCNKQRLLLDSAHPQLSVMSEGIHKVGISRGKMLRSYGPGIFVFCIPYSIVRK
jgi:hypothetical protein